jgi:4,5-DOPA dioxygenase extradiol
MHDFGGFPAELYAVRYPAPGAPALATRAAAALRAAGFAVTLDERRGFDHGAWVPMRHVFPDAATPMVQISMPVDLDTAGAFRFGEALAPLRDEGVLIVGSGSLTHNLGDLRHPPADTAYVYEFGDWVRAAAERGDTAALVDYRQRAPHAQRAHPSEEHFLPLHVALGAGVGIDPDARATWIDGGSVGFLSMEGAAWGLDAQVRRRLLAA